MLRRPNPLALFILILAVLCPALSWAKEADEAGWKNISPGVWQRSTEQGLQTRSQGAEGLATGLERLRAQLTTVVEAYLLNPTEKNRQTMERHTRFIEQVEEGLSRAKLARPIGEDDAVLGPGPDAAAACQRTFDYGAFANHSLLCGLFAHANASYSTNCPESCSVYTVVYWSRTCGSQTITQTDSCSDSGTNVSCSSSNSTPWQYDSVYTYGYAYIYCSALNNLLLTEFDDLSSTNQFGFCNC